MGHAVRKFICDGGREAGLGRERRDVTEAPDYPTGSSKSGMEHPSFPKWRQGALDFVCLHESVIRCSLLSRRGHNLTKAASFSPE